MKMKKSLYDTIYNKVIDGSLSSVKFEIWHKGMDVRINGVYKFDEREGIALDLSEFAYDHAGEFFHTANNVIFHLYIKDEKLSANMSFSLDTTEFLKTDDLMNDLEDITQEYLKKKTGEFISADKIYLSINDDNISLLYYDEEDEEIEVRCFNYFIKNINRCVKKNLKHLIDGKNFEYFLDIQEFYLSNIELSWEDNNEHIIECGE